MKSTSQYSLCVSDLLMGFLFIFILILMKFMLEYENKKADLLNPLKERDKLLEYMKKEIEKKNIQVEIDKKNGVLKLTGFHYFYKGIYELSSKGKEDFKQIQDIFERLICYSNPKHTKKRIEELSISYEDKYILKKYEKHYKEDKRCQHSEFKKKWTKYCEKNEKCNNKQNLIDSILIEGHADLTPIGPTLKKKGIKTNMDLAMKRSQTIFRVLTKYKETTKISKESGNYLYVLANSQRNPLFGVASYGNLRRTQLVTRKPSSERTDRRIDIRFIMAQSEKLKKELKNKGQK